MIVKIEQTIHPQDMTTGPPIVRYEPQMLDMEEKTFTAVKQKAKLMNPLNPRISSCGPVHCFHTAAG